MNIVYYTLSLFHSYLVRVFLTYATIRGSRKRGRHEFKGNANAKKGTVEKKFVKFRKPD